jgi:cell division protein FtsZ
LDDISTIGELVTESMDADANVIWGARVDEEMKGRLTVMTIITGVNSPWILGKSSSKETAAARQKMSSELGIEIVK